MVEVLRTQEVHVCVCLCMCAHEHLCLCPQSPHMCLRACAHMQLLEHRAFVLMSLSNQDASSVYSTSWGQNRIKRPNLLVSQRNGRLDLLPPTHS